MTTSTWGPKRSLLALLPVILLAPYIGYRHHATLPEPLPASAKGISEARILETARILSEDIGFRTVGTREHAEADAWMSGVIQQISERCKGREKIDCDVWRQEGNGNHRFDIMNTRLYKSYVGLTNFIVRIQGKSAATTEHAALINCHLDSQLPGPGAADDAISCGIMLDIINVLLDDDDFDPTWSVIFLFNHAEESLQDGSHLFSTQHPIAPSVRAVVNLEAAGTTGREILFQATSEQMIEAYSHVPRPFGVVFASDIFSSGILMSDTDFRQFQEYLNVTGLDMAIIGNSYMYHTRSDVIANIERGVAQHMGENALALVRHLASSSSPLPSLVGGYSKPSTTYWSHVVGPFVRYSKSTGLLMYGVTLLFSVGLVSWGGQGWRAVSKGMGICAMAFIGALLGANVVAIGMEVIGKSMSWFRYEAGSVALFAPGAIVGSLVPLLFISNVPSERATIEGLIVLHSVLAFIVQLFGVGSASLMWMTALPVILGLVVNDVYSAFTGTTRGKGVTLIAYAVGGFIPLTTGTLVLLPTLEVFVPLTGRMSAAAPADNLISTIITVIGSLTLPLVAPFAIRFLHQSAESKAAAPRVDKKQCLKTGLLRGLVICAVSMAIFARLEVYDEMHMRRVFVLRIENITSGEHHLHMAAADGAPGFPALVADVASALPAFISTDEKREGLEAFGVENVAMNDYNGDWDPLYPFSAFLTPYKIALPAEKASDFVSYWSDKFVVEAVEDVRDAIRGLRQLKVRITHPGLIWTVIAFDAHVVSWDLDGNPPDERARHHIKEASFYGRDVWEVNMVIKSDTPDERVLFNFIGLQEGAMWPGKRRAYDAYVHSVEVGNITHADEDWTGAVYTRGGGEAGTMGLFKELDEWLDVRMKKAVDATLIGAVGGTVWI